MIEAFKKFSYAGKVATITLLAVSCVMVIAAPVALFSGKFALAGIFAGLFAVSMGAAFIVIGIQYAHNKSKSIDIVKDLPKIIETEGETTIPELAKKYNITEGQTRHAVFECFRKNLIPGYTLSGDKIRQLTTKAQKEESKNTSVITCTGCGANFSSSDAIKKCPYCGRKYK